MKSFYILIPFVIGGLTVIQAGLNKTVGQQYGFSVAGLINNFFGFVLALMLSFGLYYWSPGDVKVPGDYKWWWFIPGCLGMIFVIGIPYSLQQLGAITTFVILVTSQMFFSVIWDFFILDQSINKIRLLGVAVALLGALMATQR